MSDIDNPAAASSSLDPATSTKATEPSTATSSAAVSQTSAAETGEYTTASGRPVRSRRRDFDRSAFTTVCSSLALVGGSSGTAGPNGTSGVQRKSTRQRVLAAKLRTYTNTKQFSTKGKSRRIILKRNPIKSTPSMATVLPESRVLHKGQYFRLGDIVSMEDVDGGTFYAQIRGLLSDQYCQYSCVVTWLLPTREANPDHFDPRYFILGPEEDCPRHLDACQLQCNLPADYFRPLSSPFHTLAGSSGVHPQLGFLMRDVGKDAATPNYEVCPVPGNLDQLYGPRKEAVDAAA